MEEQNSTINYVITVRDNVLVSSIKTYYRYTDIGNSGQEYIVDRAIEEIDSTGTFPIGETMVLFSVVDNASPNGNEGTCSFGVTISEYMPTTERAVTEDSSGHQVSGSVTVKVLMLLMNSFVKLYYLN
ncbi:uncharacterized protein LOC117108381 [Anneissia japonica]|uniref:uncharacterized protein LOC117108381 n=1 Tax=Anneissia japonica TaxID=1529436 RepID=UPI0014257F04|nr:uncharacterized protein LOC117108381 [Anneissia japonica]